MYHQFSRDEHNFFVGHLSASLHQQTKHESNGLLVLLGQEKGQAITIFCILFDHETFSPDIDDDKKLHCQLGIQPSNFKLSVNISRQIFRIQNNYCYWTIYSPLSTGTL